MTRNTPLPTGFLLAGALGSALLAAGPAAAQRGGTVDGAAAPLSSAAAQNRGAADVDRLHKGNGANGGPAELLRMAQAAMRRGQTVEANELLERAETRLLLGNDPAGPATGGEPARHVSEARRALLGRDRAEAMRHTNLAIATTRDGGSAGSDSGNRRGMEGGGPGAIDSGMGTLPTSGGTLLRDRGTGASNTNRAEGIVLAQSGAGTGTGTGPGAGNSRLPPGDTLPGWSGPRGGAAPGGAWGGTASPAPAAPFVPGVPANTPGVTDSARSAPGLFGAPNSLAAPGSSSMTGGEPARLGGAPPSDTSRAPGSSGVGGAGVGGSALRGLDR